MHPKTSIEVTATRSQEEEDQSQASTSVVTLQDIEGRNVQTLDESLDALSGLYVQRGKGPADTLASAMLRGFNGRNRTLVLLDGEPINESFYGQVPWNIIPLGHS
jgi:iron complex outermembrane recepter protein